MYIHTCTLNVIHNARAVSGASKIMPSSRWVGSLFAGRERRSGVKRGCVYSHRRRLKWNGRKRRVGGKYLFGNGVRPPYNAVTQTVTKYTRSSPPLVFALLRAAAMMVTKRERTTRAKRL